MSTSSQINANRKNGKSSRGPISEKGKETSSRNSLKHGILSRDIVLPDEDQAVFEQFHLRLLSDLKPVGELESVLAERIVGLCWRLRRVDAIEAAILQWQSLMARAIRAGEQEYQEEHPHHLEDLQPCMSPGLRKWRKARATRFRLLSEQDAVVPRSGIAFLRDSHHEEALAKLSRYETSIERSLYKALHELERLQAGRQGKDVQLPLAVDIDVSGAVPQIN